MRLPVVFTTSLLALAGAVSGPVAAAPAPAPDAALLAAAGQAQAPLLATLKELVLIESGSGDAAGLAQMAAYTERRLKALGARTEQHGPLRPGAPGRIVTGTFKGKGSKRLMLLAHMDTVYQKGILASQPYHVTDGRVYGPGIADDKGGIAVILHALKLLQDAGWRDYDTLTVVFNGDEEAGSHDSGELIAKLGAAHDFVFSCEPSLSLPDGILLGASGIGHVTLEVRGRAAHAGVAPEQGRNALIELAHQLLQTRDISKDIPGTQLNWTLAQAGIVANQIPARAVATGDLRLNVADGIAKIEAALKENIKNKLVPDTETVVTVELGRPPFIATAAARQWAVAAQGIYGEIGRELMLYPGTGGGTDASYASRSGKAVVLESFGLPGAGFHARDEYILVDSVVPRLYLLSRMLQQAGAAR